MLTPRLRFLLSAFAVLGGALRLYLAPDLIGWAAVAVGAIVLWGYFRVGTVWLALAAYRAGRVERMRSYVRSVRWPSLLASGNRAYYYWLRGVGLAIDGHVEAARAHLLLARRNRFRSSTFRSIMECQLADMALRCGDRVEAQGHLDCARAERHDPGVDTLIASVQARLSV